MICQVATANDAASVLEYMLGERDRQGRLREVRRLGGPAGISFDGVVDVIEAHARLRPGLGRHVGHASLRLAPQDRRLCPDEWREAASRLVGLAFGADTWTVVQHDETHAHVLWSRVRRDGTAVCHSNDRRRAEAATRDIEQLLGLTRIPSSWQLDPRRSPAPSRPEMPETPDATACRAAVWAAWKACRNTGTSFRAEMADREVPLCFDEALTFCIDLGDGRRVPLVHVLADCARQAGSHLPREREVLAGLKGLTLSTMDRPWVVAPPAPEVEATMPEPTGEGRTLLDDDYGLQDEPEQDIHEAGELPPAGAPQVPGTAMPDEEAPADVVEPASETRWIANPAYAAWNSEWMRRSDVRDEEAAALQRAQEHLARLTNTGSVRAFCRKLAGVWTGQDVLACARTAVALAAKRRSDAQQELEQLRGVRPHEIIREWTRPGSLTTGLADWPSKSLAGHRMSPSIASGFEGPRDSPQSPPDPRPASVIAPKMAPRRGNIAPRPQPRPGLE